MDNDLNRILSDIDSEADFQSTREEALRKSQEKARKYDANIDTPSEEESGQSFQSKILETEIDNDVIAFAKGVVPAIKLHYTLTTSFRRTLSEFDVSESVGELIKKYKYTFVRIIENIEKLFDEFNITLNHDTLLKKAKKDYGLFFQGFEEENRVDFLIIKEIFLRLREFNSRIRHEWNELDKSAAVINLISEGKAFFQSISSYIENAISFSKATDKFLQYLADILAIPKADYDVLERDILTKIIYHEEFPYRYDALFNLSVYTQDGDNAVVLDEISGTEEGEEAHIPIDAVNSESRDDEYAVTEDQPINEGEPSFIPVSEAKSLSSRKTGFVIRGTRTWNTKEPYVMSLAENKLQKEEEDLNNSFYFINKPCDENMLEGEIKRHMLSYLRDNARNIKEAYRNFIFTNIFSHKNDFSEFFSLHDRDLNLLIYHLGPFSFYKILVNVFLDTKTGSCFKYLAGNRVSRYVPHEFIKAAILEWFENNINLHPLPFDNIQEFEDIRRKISKIYYSEVDKNNAKLNEIVERAGLSNNPKFDKNEYYKSKWKNWFGTSRIIVYKRFIERTIFK